MPIKYAVDLCQIAIVYSDSVILHYEIRHFQKLENKVSRKCFERRVHFITYFIVYSQEINVPEG